MIKISLSKEIEEKHFKYCSENILPGIKKANLFSVDKIEFKLEPCFDIQVFNQEEKNFWAYIIENFEEISIGKPDVLRKHDKKIKKLFATVAKGIEVLKSKNKNTKSYSQYLLEKFRYEEFKSEDLFDILLKKTKKRSNIKNYSFEVQKLMIKDLLKYLPSKKRIIYESFFENGTIKNLKRSDFEIGFKNLGIDLTIHNFKNMITSVDAWSDYTFVMESSIRVCPYCNRQYITPVFSDNGKLRGEIDHFLPKSIYPYFSMSLYNMIPVCHTCNHIKGDKKFGFDSINPFEESLNDHFTFEVNPVTQELTIKTCDKNDEAIKLHIDTLKLKSLYGYHNNQALELLKKRSMYPDIYIIELFKVYGESFVSIEEFKEFIVGYIADENQLNNEAFLKLRRDIAKQLNFLTEPAEAAQIKELKKLQKICSAN
ncbi:MULTISPECIES: HNH endonuclease domain-containing protein [unclassified Acetobacterium]|jgi:hypothetical protein|uniref:HNH endonuclease domain-containing protein n=1 Tax=unclassified Acetobacterium TaxID=2638182 RepID=UPI000DBEC062|nr:MULTISPECIES: HNH endonuclease domain-containing protein [unclassified Acetobacterium]AWW25530.1 HNH endonuclease [Acetobacterium sp. KB-1]MDZ5726723.1 HNH endonuclease domain-containing protein [Acetobacterium sp. K1/6]